ncbi:leucine-rich repeat protein [Butyrivibrio sp. AD3002]|uniref:leucine-rich repeat protein n=1 Tax=Butyrivibrio sp. AD3002 TaxID=1280670 RepID=UPI0003B45FF7|nr:leucine-rich repeat protein [Butyrivibrio sp. AD3002]
MRLFKKILSSVIAFSLVTGLWCGTSYLAKAGTSSTFNINLYTSDTFESPIKEYPNGATLVFDGNTDISVNKNLQAEGILATPLVIFIDKGNNMKEDGYDILVNAHGQAGGGIPVLTNLPANTDYTGLLTIPVPDGYNPASAKYYDINDHLWKAVTSYTESTVTYPVEGGLASFIEYGMIFQIGGDWYTEYKKAATDISTLKGQATIPQNSYTYSGSAIEPEVTIPGLTKEKDFKVEYAKNTDPGTATITVTGIYNCYGSFTIEFTITKEDKNAEDKKTEYNNTEYKDEDASATYILNTDKDGNVTATYKGSTNKKAKKITIPTSITLPDGTKATVTEIGPNAFKGSKATQITIPSTVTKISSKAFAGSEAKKIIIKTDKKGNISIGKGAFKSMKAKNVQIIIKGCKGKAKDKLIKKVKKQAPKGTKVK